MTTSLAMGQVEWKETTTSIAKRTNALVSINGSYFIVTCTNDSELIQFKSIYGKETPKDNGTEVILDQSGKVIELTNLRGHEITKTSSVIAGTGEASDWVNEHAKIGMELTNDTNVLKNGKPLLFNNQTHDLTLPIKKGKI